MSSLLRGSPSTVRGAFVPCLLAAGALLCVSTTVLPAQPAITPRPERDAMAAPSWRTMATRDSLRPFGTLREQAVVRQQWLERRMETILPALMRKYNVDMWVIPMREYNEDPAFRSLVSPTTFAARRRTIYVFFDRGAEGIERIAFGGTNQGGVYKAIRSTKAVDAPAAGSRSNDRTAELWGDDQWQVLRAAVEERQPKRIALNWSRTWHFADGLTHGEYEGLTEALGAEWQKRIVPAEGLAVDFIASRLPEEEATFERMNALAWEIIAEAFSERVITPGKTRTEDVLWWMRQRLEDLGLQTWFQPSVEVQRFFGNPELVGPNPVIMRGDVLHCDFGISAMGLATDTQHMGYVLKAGETDVPAGLKSALLASNRLQDFSVEELRPGRTGNQILAAVLARAKAAGIDGTIYSHPIGANGHGSGTIIGLWDYQEGVPGRGDFPVIANMWYSIELQATVPVPEWNGQRVRSAQEEDVIIAADGRVRWARGRQTTFHLVR
ncbi:MAG: aminopeptidase P family protein [Gemmatimonadaceae bacterium]|nr:aminopeptidase P family protein [Gemmatimonadaceae bacterium]